METLQNFLTNLSVEQCFAFYRNPDTSHIHLLTLSKTYASAVPEDYFTIAGFNEKEGSKYHIKAEYIVDYNQIENIVKSNYHFDLGKIPSEKNTSHLAYVSMVQSAINQINVSKLEKVVLARCLFQPKEIKNLFAIFQKLLSYQSAFVYILNDSSRGTWAGASPEYLLYKNGNEVSSMALAGTKLISANEEWTEKEVEEQNIVANYLHKTFISNYLQDVKTSNPKTITTGLLQHICSLTTGVLTHENRLAHLITQMHPTPALGGYPKDEALKFIENYEGFNRQLYGGYLGRKTNQKLSLFVNIRCMRLGNNGIQYFAGAGINAQSDPEKEWLETSNKMLVMQSIIKDL